MTSSYTGVIPATSSAEALDLLAHVDHVEAELDALRGASDRSTNAHIADRRNEIGSTFKRAEVLSNLAIAEALDRLTVAVARWDEVKRSHSREIYLSAIHEGEPHR